MESILEIILEILLLIIVQYPGALIRWVIFRRKSYSSYVADDLYLNAFPVIMLTIAILLLTR